MADSRLDRHKTRPRKPISAPTRMETRLWMRLTSMMTMTESSTQSKAPETLMETPSLTPSTSTVMETDVQMRSKVEMRSWLPTSRQILPLQEQSMRRVFQRWSALLVKPLATHRTRMFKTQCVSIVMEIRSLIRLIWMMITTESLIQLKVMETLTVIPFQTGLTSILTMTDVQTQ